MTETERLKDIVRTLRSENGCPWDRQQTHDSLKPECIEEAAEVIAGINILRKTGDAENLKEELGDLLLQVMFHSVIAEEEGLFTFDDVAAGVSKNDKAASACFCGSDIQFKGRTARRMGSDKEEGKRRKRMASGLSDGCV